MGFHPVSHLEGLIQVMYWKVTAEGKNQFALAANFFFFFYYSRPWVRYHDAC